MTGEDIMPFGKYNKESCKIKDVPESYRIWLRQQDWWLPKWTAIDSIWQGKVDEVSTKEERENIDHGTELLYAMEPSFQVWWRTAYGERLRKASDFNYLPMLRVAIEAWKGALKAHNPISTEKPVTPPVRAPDTTTHKINHDAPATEDIPF